MSQDNEVKRDNPHLINAVPHLYEIDDMLDFCGKYERLYICGAGENQEYLLKFLDICKVKINGYTVTDPSRQQLFWYRQMPIAAVDDVIKSPNTGIILGLSDKHYRYFIPKFRKSGFSDYFVMTEYNKHTIASQMRPRERGAASLEINLADHCNLPCQGCDHYSQLSDESFLNYDSYKRDIERLGELYSNKIGIITLLGGEPLLHENIIDFMKITRKVFPEAKCFILTNGLLLLQLENALQGNIWQACKDYKFGINVTVYPIKLDFAGIAQKAKQYDVPLRMSSDIHAEELTTNTKISDKHTFDLSGNQPLWQSIGCIYFNKWTVLKDGKLYMCPISAHIPIFNKFFDQSLELLDDDSIDIYSADKWEAFSEFNAKPVSFCRFCDLKNWVAASEWGISKKVISEYV